MLKAVKSERIELAPLRIRTPAVKQSWKEALALEGVSGVIARVSGIGRDYRMVNFI